MRTENADARAFWERVYIESCSARGIYGTPNNSERWADAAMSAWLERFGPDGKEKP